MWRNRVRLVRVVAMAAWVLPAVVLGLPSWGAGIDPPTPEGACVCERSLTLTAGRLDACQLPVEVTSRRADLDAWPNAVWKEFDDVDINEWVGHTFSGLPTGITSARLEVTMEPTCNAGNDTISLLLNGGSFDFGSPISALPEAGGTWNCSQNDKTTFTFDLDALGLTGQVAADQYLDFLVQDDTTVDGAQLILLYCTDPVERTYRCGRDDDFQSPDDPTFRRAAMEAAFVADWKEFDDPTLDEFMGCSVANLPSDLLDARLDIRMRPLGGLSDNDSLNMVLVGSSMQFNTSIRNLPEAGGSWIANGPTTFQLDLDALGLMSQVDNDGYFDFLIQDDTEVDFATLGVAACGPLEFGGWPCIPVGDAQLFEPLPGQFELVGIDDTGDDGISIEVGEAQGFCLQMESVCLGAKGTALDLVSSGRIFTAEEDLVEGRMSFLSDGVNVGVDAGFDAPFDQFLNVFVQDDGVQVAAHLAISPGLVATLPATACIDEVDDRGTCLQVLFTEDVEIIIEQGGPTIFGDRLLVCRDSGPTGTEFVVQRFDVRFANVDSVRFTGAQLEQFDHLHAPLGEARLEAFGGDLTLDNLGSSGEDGVRIALDEAGSFDLTWLPLDGDGSLPPDAALDVRAFGSLDGVPEQSLGSLVVSKGAQGIAFDADFTQLGSPTQRVQILNQGVVVTDLSGLSGTAVVASDWPHGLGKLGGSTECFVGWHPEGTEFTVDGSVVVGDEVRILSEGAAVVDFKSAFELRAADIGELTVTGASSTSQNDIAGAVFRDGFESGDLSAWSNAVP